MAEKQGGGPPSEQEGPPPAYTTQPAQPGYPPQGPQPAYPGQPVYPAQTAGVPPQQGAYVAQQGPYVGQQTAQTVIVTQPGYAAGPILGSSVRYRQDPMLIICQHCNATVTTSTTYETGLLTYAAAGIICLFGCWFGCCLIPFCVDASKDVIHNCPNCNQLCGKFRHFS